MLGIQGRSPDGVQHSGQSWQRVAQSKARSSKLAMAMAVQTTHTNTPPCHSINYRTLTIDQLYYQYQLPILILGSKDMIRARGYWSGMRVRPQAVDGTLRKRNLAGRGMSHLQNLFSNCCSIYVLRSLAFNGPLTFFSLGVSSLSQSIT